MIEEMLSAEDKIDILSRLDWYADSFIASMRMVGAVNQPNQQLKDADLNLLSVLYAQAVTTLATIYELMGEVERKTQGKTSSFEDLCKTNYRAIKDDYDGEFFLDYLREYRNAIVHRGERISDSGERNVSGYMDFVVPKIMNSQKKTKQHPRYAKTINETIHVAAAVCCCASIRYLLDRKILEEIPAKLLTDEDLADQFSKYEHIPDWVRKATEAALPLINEHDQRPKLPQKVCSKLQQLPECVFSLMSGTPQS